MQIKFVYHYHILNKKRMSLLVKLQSFFKSLPSDVHTNLRIYI